MKLKCDGVFEGGGVRGIGLVGAACVVQDAGYEFVNLAGSSAGAIVASLLAVGYTGAEINQVMQTLDYMKFKQKDFLDHFGAVGKTIGFWSRFGIYSADYFEGWLNDLLIKKGKTTFGDIKFDNPSSEKYAYKLQVTASDVTDQRLLLLPGDLKSFGIDPDTYSIAKAVRMSMSIPVFYEPFHLKGSDGRDHLIVDGGLLSNYPIWILDDGTSDPPWPTFGFKFVDSSKTKSIAETKSKINVIEYIKLIVSTALEAHDNQYISNSKGDFQRTIPILTTFDVDGVQKAVGTTDFGITKEQSESLFNNGVQAAEKFMATWDFDSWKKAYRSSVK